jgi:hypothetical protein
VTRIPAACFDLVEQAARALAQQEEPVRWHAGELIAALALALDEEMVRQGDSGQARQGALQAAIDLIEMRLERGRWSIE